MDIIQMLHLKLHDVEVKKSVWKPVRFQSIRINMSCCQYAGCRLPDHGQGHLALITGNPHCACLGESEAMISLLAPCIFRS